jgi:hypothetical protein
MDLQDTLGDLQSYQMMGVRVTSTNRVSQGGHTHQPHAGATALPGDLR